MLKESAFFCDFGDDLLDLIAACTKTEHFNGGSYLIRVGERSETFYLIRHGSVALELVAPPKGRLVLQTVHEGDVVGWSWLVPPFRWVYDARAISLVRTLTFDARRLHALCETNHELGYRLLSRFVKVLSGRVMAARMQLLDLYAPMAGSDI